LERKRNEKRAIVVNIPKSKGKTLGNMFLSASSLWTNNMARNKEKDKKNSLKPQAAATIFLYCVYISLL
jgi:predicted alpha/beta superfamily hydrolase